MNKSAYIWSLPFTYFDFTGSLITAHANWLHYHPFLITSLTCDILKHPALHMSLEQRKHSSIVWDIINPNWEYLSPFGERLIILSKWHWNMFVVRSKTSVPRFERTFLYSLAYEWKYWFHSGIRQRPNLLIIICWWPEPIGIFVIRCQSYIYNWCFTATFVQKVG